MKFRYVISALLSMLMLISFILDPSALTLGAIEGLGICGRIIIPSLFPFTAIVLFLFNCGIFSLIERPIDKLTLKIFRLPAKAFFAVLMSFAGGFPVGAKLVNTLAEEGTVSEKTAERMMCYCVNPGPAFMIIGIGANVFSNPLLGAVIYFCTVLSSLTVMLMLSRKESKKVTTEHPPAERSRLSDTFVTSVASAAESILGICGYVILFSSLISVMKSFATDTAFLPLLSLLEISNGVMIIGDNVYALAFLTAFSGFCIHFQILSICRAFRLDYKRFFLFRLLNGGLTTLFTFAFIKLFKISVPTISAYKDYIFSFTSVSIPLCAALIFMSVTLLITIKQNNVEKRASV